MLAGLVPLLPFPNTTAGQKLYIKLRNAELKHQTEGHRYDKEITAVKSCHSRYKPFLPPAHKNYSIQFTIQFMMHKWQNYKMQRWKWKF